MRGWRGAQDNNQVTLSAQRILFQSSCLCQVEVIDTAVLTSGVSRDGKLFSLFTSLAIRDDSGLDISSRGKHELMHP